MMLLANLIYKIISTVFITTINKFFFIFRDIIDKYIPLKFVR